MIKDMKVPSPGESISEVEIAQWLKKDGDYVYKDEEIVEVDSDKATLAIPAEDSGQLQIVVKEGEVPVGEVICKIDTSAKAPEKAKDEGKTQASESKSQNTQATKEDKSTATQTTKAEESTAKPTSDKSAVASPAANKIMAEKNISSSQIHGTGKDGRITKQDIVAYLANGFDADATKGWGGTRDVERKRVSSLRRKIAERLVSVKNETAMLTTFNEVDMQPIMDMRRQYKEIFKEKHDVGLGFMSFFTKAVTEALNIFPAVNAQLDGEELLMHNYADIGIAVSTPKGLMVPVIRNAETLSLAGIEKEVDKLARKAREGNITIDDMTGGTFTLTNGGVFGSLMSTPIINPPQVAILGMHKIEERPIVVNKQMVIKPMMYLALSYDHRVIDGKESVSFLVKVKEMLENPIKMIFGGKNPQEVLLGL